MGRYDNEQKQIRVAEKPFALSVKVIIADKDDRCLIIRRSANSKFNAGRWDFPGGKVDAGETFDQALVREVEEETGLRISLDRVGGAAQSEMPDRIVAYLIMQGRIDSGQVSLSSEHDEFAWVPRSDLIQIDLCPQFRAFAATFADSS